MAIVSTFSPEFNPRSTVPPSSGLRPTHGVQPIVRSSVVDLRFHKRAARRCWMLIIIARVPSPIGDNAVASCSVGEIITFGNFNNPRHPIHAYLRQLPDQACLFDSTVTIIDAVISRRAPIVGRYFHLWQACAVVLLAIALWERHHWVSQRAVRNMALAMLRNSSFSSEVAKAILVTWSVYFKHRKQRTGVRWIQYKRTFQSEWIVDEQDTPERHPPIPPELVFEPSAPAMSLKRLTWVPAGED
ncbi:hypothetical protein GN958_ATG06834 [Phytophthora infestans]|uniref:Uncharacterized protein n=1 Tax=Phytophthora infestans TaxID=4787 RepID=A0A8S9UYB0_PHYIN|nr:hypothetical protein GN958_ATG06834 [Phytophthora infestans]